MNESKKIFFDINGGFPRWMFFNSRRFLPQKHRQMNKFVLHCNRCTIVTRFFNLDFGRIYKKSTLGRRFPSKKNFFLSEKANFSASDQLGKNFPAVQTGPEKTKNQIKLVSK